MRARLVRANLLDISDKLDAGVRLTADEGVRLFECPDLLSVGWLANREREKRHGARTFYNFNIRLEATNVCVESTARDAYMRDDWVVCVSDCTASASEAAHEATLVTMGRHFATVAAGGEILASWRAQPSLAAAQPV